MFFFHRLRSGGNLFIFIAGALLAVFLFLLIAVVFLGQTRVKDMTRQHAVSELEQETAIPDSSPQRVTSVDGQEESPLRAAVSGTDRVLGGPFRLEDAEGYLLSPWLPGAIAILTLPLLVGLGYLLHLNNQNLVLKTRHALSQEKRAILRRQRDMQRMISDAVSGLLEAPVTEMNGAIETALRRSGEQCYADRAYFVLWSDVGRCIGDTHEWCAPGIAPQRDKAQDLRLERAPWWRERISQGGIVIVPDVAALPPEARAEKAVFEGQQIQSLFACPLQKDGKTFGFLRYDAMRHQRDWASEEIELLEVMADVVVSALARWRVEIELKESEERLKESQSVAKLGHYSYNIESDCWTSSDVLNDIFCIGEDYRRDLHGWLQLVHSDSREELLSYFEHHILRQHRRFDKEYRIVDPKSRREKWVHGLGDLKLDEEGNPVELFGTIQDITERKRAEQGRNESDTLFSKAFQAAGTLMTISILDTGVLEDVNDAFVEISGYSYDEAVGTSAVELGLISPDDRDRLKCELLRDGALTNLEVKFTAKDGGTIYCLYNGEIIEIDGKKKLLSILQDVTPLKQSQLALKASEERFALAMRGSNDGVYDWDLRTNAIYYSPRWKSMLGYAEDELENRFESWERLVDPEDRERSWAMLRDYMEGKRDKFSLEFRMRHKDGHWVDVLSRAYLVRDEKGTPLRVVGTHLDVSERKRTQRQVEDERNRTRQYLNIAGVMLVALDRSGRVTLINPKGCELLGLPEKEILNRDWFDNFLPHDDVTRVRAIFSELMSGHVEPAEYFENPILTAQGSQRLIAWHNSIIRDDEDRIAGILSSGEDVTRHRDAERALREERTFLQHVIDGIDDPILVINPDYSVLRMNREAREAAKSSGLDPSCVTCHQVTHLNGQPCSGEDRPCPLRLVLETGSPSKVLHKHLGPNGEQRTFEIAASPLLNDNGQIRGIIEVSRDITEHLALINELKVREIRYAHLAQHDPLTGLPNRLLFADRLSHAIHVAHRNRTRFAVLYIDLDQFKHVNDSFDHSYGDEVLKAVSSRLQSLFREDDTIARMGGDEFTVILNNIRYDEDAALVAGKILNVFKEPFDIQGHGVFLGASIGISIYAQHGTTVDDLVRNADSAMYRAKEEGRNTFQYYSEELTARAVERVLLESNLRKAVDRGELVLHYQPQLNLATGDVCGLEALVRWQHPKMGLIPPVKFIPLAEDSGIIVPMGEWILCEACRQMKTWQDTGIVAPDTMISVNLSGKQFDQSGLMEMIRRVIHDTGLEADTLELEITESTMMRSPDLSGHILQQLRDLGVKVAIDDFGTGYSSMSHLKLLPLTKLKIDKSFVSDIPQDLNDVAIAKAVIALANSLSLEVLAEGVETQEQRAFLTQEGCHSGQGYLFSRPVQARDLEAYMHTMNQASAESVPARLDDALASCTK